MKKLTSLLFLLCLIEFASAQTNTTQGFGVGTGGSYNSLFGYAAGSNTIGNFNTGIGAFSLRSNTDGYYNTALGTYSLYSNTDGTRNVALGNNALRNNLAGFDNVSVGYDALRNNTFGHKNTAIGHRAANSNIEGNRNTAVGHEALSSNTGGDLNTSIGDGSMKNNIYGAYNTANGSNSLRANTSGNGNTAIGSNAAEHTNGYMNTAIGTDALQYNSTGNFNTAVGYAAINTGSYNYSTALGVFTEVTASYQVRIGAYFMNSIGGYQNWTNLSDGRFKKEVKEDVLGLDFIKQLRPVSYYVDNKAVKNFLGVKLEDEAIDNQKRYQTGFIAQEVEATAKELGFEHFGGVDAPENEESHYGLRYAEFVVPLVKSVQELSAENEDQKATIETLKEAIAQQQLQINTLLNSSKNTLDIDGVNSQTKAKLYQNTPNPFSNETQIKLFVPREVGQALIQVCTIDGKQLFVKEVEGRDETSITVSASDLPAGIYMYTLVVDNEIITSKRMVLTQ